MIWRSKALATQQLMQRRQLLQAAAGRPELARLASDLQTTRQQLAWLSLSAPLGDAAERKRQLSELTGRKEDLERQLAQLSEPFRRTRDAGRASVADMVRRLPGKTAVVDFVERWQWTPPAKAVAPTVEAIHKEEKPKEEKPRDALPVGSIWKGERHLDQGDKTVPATLKITARDGPSFKGEFAFDKGNVNEVAGTLTDQKIEWRTTKVLQGDPNQETIGTLNENSIDATFKFVPRKRKKKHTVSGTIKLSSADARPAEKEETKAEPATEAGKETTAPGTWVQTRCYDAFVLRAAAEEPGWSVAWVSLGDADALDKLLDGWMASLRSKTRADAAIAGQLRRRLWAPLEAALGDCKMVIFIPDGRLAQMPWAALPGRRPDSYLLEDYALVEAPYGQYVARLLMDPAPQGESFLAVGGIDYGPGGKWPYLKGTADEVEQLLALRPGKETVRVVGDAATKPHVRELLPGRRYIHLATHGQFLDPEQTRDGMRVTEGSYFDASARNPLLSSMLVFAGANRPALNDGQGLPAGSDSFLTAEEVTGMDLTGTELVVLSACETGLGKVRSGEGVFSLQRAFHVGGSRAVVSSLWKVPDRATQALMGRFYSNLWQGKMSKVEALREAQSWLLHEGKKQAGSSRGIDLSDEPLEPANSHASMPPFFWAAFVLSGDWR